MVTDLAKPWALGGQVKQYVQGTCLQYPTEPALSHRSRDHLQSPLQQLSRKVGVRKALSQNPPKQNLPNAPPCLLCDLGQRKARV
jgi:hypothetical protein